MSHKMENYCDLKECLKQVYLRFQCSALVSRQYMIIELSQNLGLTQLLAFLQSSIHKEAIRIILEEWPMTKLLL